MNWYNYLAAFFAGMFLANAVPHFVHGVSGDPFPSPFSHPPGEGLSSPTVNVLWALFNLLVGYLLLLAGHVAPYNMAPLLTCFAGIVAISVMLSIQFQKKHSR